MEKYQNRNLRGKELELYKYTLNLTQLQRDVIIGTLLGDASINRRDGKSMNSIKYEQAIKNKDYIYHIYDILEPFCGTAPLIRDITGGGARDRQSVWFRTYSHREFAYYYDLFYRVDENNKSYKIIPYNIKEILTPRAIAYWYMDDGSYCGSLRYPVIHTQGFSLEDQEYLKLIFKELYNIDITVYKDRKYNYIKVDNISRNNFISLIKPYIFPIFNYKIDNITIIKNK